LEFRAINNVTNLIVYMAILVTSGGFLGAESSGSPVALLLLLSSCLLARISSISAAIFLDVQALEAKANEGVECGAHEFGFFVSDELIKFNHAFLVVRLR
jgi:hypothetical protein